MRRWVGCLLLRCSCCKLVNKQWKNDMNLCSVLHPRKAAMQIRCCLPLPELKRSVEVPAPVKFAIIAKVRSSEGCLLLTNGTASLQSVPSSHVRDRLLQACSGKGSTTDVLLVWHIATTILEVRRTTAAISSSFDNVVVATHLSGYCAYLVAYCPELLPDDDGWSKSLYKAVTEDARRALAVAGAGRAPEEEYKKLVRLLGAGGRHEVVERGAKLAKKLVALAHGEGEEKAWEVLAGFWSEMILYVAPSDNLEGHAKAIARGGELITLLWALLTHAGVVTRPSTATATAADHENASAV
ncbi:uncharacterized protein LOC127779263 [Oryza glaberrima]|uniref:uncharacterized protein LOC127779263 n=1 Tax=Oryza glaberrima TaxID=4538 RepID=UPI00224BF4CB|nr:uncharacterized protein LOC127779263 [Oryza glaberrima]